MQRADAIIERIQDSLGGARQPELSHAHYDRAHEVFEGASSQQGLILEWLRGHLVGQFATRDRLRVLSVGCGSGILDTRVIRAVAGDGRRGLEYTALDPNAGALRRFRDAFAELGLPRVRLTVAEGTVETHVSAEPFDVIHAVQSLYYFQDPAAAIDSLLDRLDPGGRLLIFHAPKGALNRLADCFWSHPGDGEIWFSERLERHLEEAGHDFTRESLLGRVDVTACSEPGDPRGSLLLDFITQTSSRELPGSTLAMTRQFLREVSEVEAGRMLTPHPVDVFTISRGR